MTEREAATGPRSTVRRLRADLLGLRLFDHRWYRDVAGRSGRKIGLYRHFLAEGWRDGFDPNGWFPCARYLCANPDVAESGLNPWVHFVRSGRHEGRQFAPDAQPQPLGRSTIGPLTLDETLAEATRSLVDEPFYLAAYDDVETTGLRAAEHFAAYGGKEGRAPAPWFNVEYLRTHAPSYRLGAGNPLVDLLRITTGAPPPVPASASWWINPDAAVNALRGIQKAAETLVIIHAYYPDDLEVFSKYLARLGSSVQVVMTCPEGAAPACQRWANRCALEATIAETVNRGRDWGPFLAVAHEIGKSDWEAVLKLHTKRSPHRQDGAEWLKHVLDGLVPDESTVSRVRSILADGRKDILAAPGSLSSARGWKPEGRIANQLYWRYVGQEDQFQFPAGSMLWMSERLLVQVGALPLTISDFEPELGQLDGTLAHALERLVVRVAPGAVGAVPC